MTPKSSTMSSSPTTIGVLDVVLLDERRHVFPRAGVNRHAKHLEILSAKVSMQFPQDGDGFEAGRTPDRPEVQEHDFSLQGTAVERIALQVRGLEIDGTIPGSVARATR